jgi:hypothetical protein
MPGVKGRPRNWEAWAPQEKAILHDVYPKAGRRGVQAALRSAGYERTAMQIALPAPAFYT